MKAVQVTGYGGIEKLEYTDKPIPELKKGEVLIKVKACAINNTEIWMREGAYGQDKQSGWHKEGVPFPRIPGSDIAGHIVKISPSVDPSMLGKDVVLFPFTSSGEAGSEHIAEDMSFIGSEYDGGYAEYVTWPAELCYTMPLPDYTESAVFSVSALTAWHMATQLNIQPGDTILITGANGGVGSFAVQIAAHVYNAQVIAVVGDLALGDTLKDLGATHVVSYRSKDLAKDILSVNEGPIDAVLDVVGEALFDVALTVLKKGGKFCVSGSSGGQKTTLDFRTLYLKHLTLYGSVLGTKEEYRALLKAVAEGKVKPLIDRTFPLKKAGEAQTYFKKAGKLGKVVLLPE